MGEGGWLCDILGHSYHGFWFNFHMQLWACFWVFINVINLMFLHFFVYFLCMWVVHFSGAL